jgi:outer membrane protein TolC
MPRLAPHLPGLAATVVIAALPAFTLVVARAEPAPPLDLERALALSLTRNERASIAEQDQRRAEARVARARALFFPELELGGGARARGPVAPGQDRAVADLTATVSLSLFDGRARPLYRQALAERAATDLEAADDRRRLLFETADAYLQTLGLERVADAAVRRQELAAQNLADAQGRQKSDLAGENDVTRAELELATAERELTQARANLDAGRLALGYLIGGPVGGALVEPAGLVGAGEVGPGELAPLVDAAQARRLDVRARGQRAAAANAAAAEPRARFWPRVALIGQAGLSTNQGPTGEHHDWLVGLTVTWSIWDGGARAAEHDERAAAAAIVDLDLAAQRRRVEVEIETALSALAAARGLLAQADRALGLAQKNADETATLYRRGLVRAFELADAAARRFDAEVARARASYSLGLAVLDLRAALGFDPLGREVPLR